MSNNTDGIVAYVWTGAPSAYRVYTGPFLLGVVRRERGSVSTWVGLAYNADGSAMREADGQPAYVRASTRASTVTAMLAARRAAGVRA